MVPISAYLYPAIFKPPHVLSVFFTHPNRSTFKFTIKRLWATYFFHLQLLQSRLIQLEIPLVIIKPKHFLDVGRLQRKRSFHLSFSAQRPVTQKILFESIFTPKHVRSKIKLHWCSRTSNYRSNHYERYQS